MKHYFLDTNVVLDYLAERAPFWTDAAELMQAGLDRQAKLYVASLSFANIYYLLRRATSAPQAREFVGKLEKLVTVAAFDSAIISQAIASPFADFEDAIQHYAATAVPAIEAIATRDLRDFASSALPVLTPGQALTQLDAA